MKIANIDREILHNFWTTWRISRKMWLTIILKLTTHKKPGFHPLFRRSIFRKTTGGGRGGQIDNLKKKLQMVLQKKSVKFKFVPPIFAFLYRAVHLGFKTYAIYLIFSNKLPLLQKWPSSKTILVKYVTEIRH